MLTAKRRRLLTRQLLRDPWCVAAWKAAAYDSANALLFDLGPKGNHPLLLGAGANAPLHLPWTGRTHMWFPGAGLGTNYLWLADAAALKILGDIDIIVCVVLPDYTPGTTQTLMGKWAGAGARSYALNLNTDGTLQLLYTTDGTTAVSWGLASAATGVTDGATTWLRATADANDGAGNRVVKFYKSSDPVDTAPGSVSWTQIGTTQTTAGVNAGTFDSTANLHVFAHTNGTAGLTAGKLYRAALRNGYDGAGSFVADVDTSLATSSPATFAERISGATVTIVQSGTGRKSSVVDRTRFVLGTDDYFAHADHDDFDFVGPFTIALAMLRFGVPSATEAYVNKRDVAANANAGITLQQGAGSTSVTGRISDGTNTSTDTVSNSSGLGTPGLLTFKRNVGADTIEVDWRGVNAAGTTDDNTASIANALAFEIGRNSAPNYGAFEFFGASVHQRWLSPSEVVRLGLEFGVAA